MKIPHTLLVLSISLFSMYPVVAESNEHASCSQVGDIAELIMSLRQQGYDEVSMMRRVEENVFIQSIISEAYKTRIYDLTSSQKFVSEDFGVKMKNLCVQLGWFSQE